MPNGPTDNTWALVQVMDWRRIGDKPLPEPIMTAIWRHQAMFNTSIHTTNNTSIHIINSTSIHITNNTSIHTINSTSIHTTKTMPGLTFIWQIFVLVYVSYYLQRTAMSIHYFSWWCIYYWNQFCIYMIILSPGHLSTLLATLPKYMYPEITCQYHGWWSHGSLSHHGEGFQLPVAFQVEKWQKM